MQLAVQQGCIVSCIQITLSGLYKNRVGLSGASRLSHRASVTELFHGVFHCWLNSGLVQNSYREHRSPYKSCGQYVWVKLCKCVSSLVGWAIVSHSTVFDNGPLDRGSDQKPFARTQAIWIKIAAASWQNHLPRLDLLFWFVRLQEWCSHNPLLVRRGNFNSGRRSSNWCGVHCWFLLRHSRRQRHGKRCSGDCAVVVCLFRICRAKLAPSWILGVWFCYCCLFFFFLRCNVQSFLVAENR